MILSAHQPAYLPWLGYFDKIARADMFVFLDTVQYEKNSFINRNRIKTPQGVAWLTIPVRTKGHTGANLRTTQIDESQPWRARHLRTIELSYRRAARFDERFPRLDALIDSQDLTLADYCHRQLQFWLRELAIDTPVIRASTLPEMGVKSDLVLDLCRHFGADRYLSGAMGRDYLVQPDFDAEGVRIEYQDFVPQPYHQLWGAFVPGLSVLDRWLNT